MTEFEKKAREIIEPWPNLNMECDEEAIVASIVRALEAEYARGIKMACRFADDTNWIRHAANGQTLKASDDIRSKFALKKEIKPLSPEYDKIFQENFESLLSTDEVAPKKEGGG